MASISTISAPIGDFDVGQVLIEFGPVQKDYAVGPYINGQITGRRQELQLFEGNGGVREHAVLKNKEGVTAPRGQLIRAATLAEIIAVLAQRPKGALQSIVFTNERERDPKTAHSLAAQLEAVDNMLEIRVENTSRLPTQAERGHYNLGDDDEIIEWMDPNNRGVIHLSRFGIGRDSKMICALKTVLGVESK